MQQKKKVHVSKQEDRINDLKYIVFSFTKLNGNDRHYLQNNNYVSSLNKTSSFQLIKFYMGF